MAKGGYIGDGNNKARKIKKGYIGDENGKARKVKKGYIGDVNGKARLFWTSNINTLVTWSSTGNRTAYSDNLQTWVDSVEVNEEVNEFYYGTFGNDRFARFAQGITSYSTNGINWTQATESQNLNIRLYEFIDGKFIGYRYMVNGAGTYYTSTNGYTWTANNLNMTSSQPLNFSPTRVIKAENKYVMIGYNSQSNYSQGMIFMSDDMINWSLKHYFNTVEPIDIAYGGNGRFAIIVFTNSFTSSLVYTTDNFFNTTKLTEVYSNYRRIAFGNGVFVSVSSFGEASLGRINYSTDGVNWIQALSMSAGIQQLEVIFTGEKFYCVGTQGTSYYSTNGINWTQMTGLSSESYANLLYSIDGGGKQPWIS